MKGKMIAMFMLLVCIASLLMGCTNTNGNTSGNATNEANAANGKDAQSSTIGISLPTQELSRWSMDGVNIQKQLEDAGHQVELYYADNDVETQISQIEAMQAAEVDILIIAAVDGEALTDVLESVKESAIPIIAYDRLIMNTDALSYYVTFDNYAVGHMQGTYIEEMLDLENAENRTFTIELFAGDPYDNNTEYVFGGAMDVLKKYINAGVLLVPSEEIMLEDVTTLHWSTEEAYERMKRLLAFYNTNEIELDAILCANDSIASGVIQALEEFYLTSSQEYDIENDVEETERNLEDSTEEVIFPILTGQDCDIENVKYIISQKQGMSVFKDTRILAEQVVEMVEAILSGEEVEVNDEKTYHNGHSIIPTFLCEPVVTTQDNYKKILIQSEYYKEADFR